MCPKNWLLQDDRQIYAFENLFLDVLFGLYIIETQPGRKLL